MDQQEACQVTGIVACLAVMQEPATGITTNRHVFRNLHSRHDADHRLHYQVMTIVQQIQLRKHVSDILRRRGVTLGSLTEYEKRVYNIFESYWKRHMHK